MAKSETKIRVERNEFHKTRSKDKPQQPSRRGTASICPATLSSRTPTWDALTRAERAEVAVFMTLRFCNPGAAMAQQWLANNAAFVCAVACRAVPVCHSGSERGAGGRRDLLCSVRRPLCRTMASHLGWVVNYRPLAWIRARYLPPGDKAGAIQLMRITFASYFFASGRLRSLWSRSCFIPLCAPTRAGPNSHLSVSTAAQFVSSPDPYDLSIMKLLGLLAICVLHSCISMYCKARCSFLRF